MLVVAGDNAAAASESAFPYSARVLPASASVRSGPSAEDYATQEMPHGAAVEVHRRDAGGWLAIRPPAGSFSLVAADYLQSTEQADIAEVVSPHAVAWVGTKDEDVQDLKWQIRLDVGERVVVGGVVMQRTRASGPVERYYRIEPPRGEFRWVAEHQVRHPSQPPPVPEREAVALAELRVVAAPADEPLRRDGFVARGSRSKDEAEPVTPAVSADASSSPATTGDASSQATAPRAGGESEARAETDARLKELDVQLSLALAQPAANWKLEKIKAAVEVLLQEASTTVARGRIQLLLETIAEAQRLQSRQAVSAARDTAGRATEEPGLLSDVLAPRFDGTGWLAPVWSRTRSAPPYALVNAEGDVLQWVSPAPGLNLHRYLRKEIGVFGQQSTTSHLDKPHLTAQRVVDLERHRR